jgi:hypothetical protein
MKKQLAVLSLSIFFLLSTGCTTTFMGTVLVLGFRDIIYYVMIAFVLAVLISLTGSGEGRKTFWIWFLLSLLLTPLAGFIYLLVQFTRK